MHTHACTHPCVHPLHLLPSTAPPQTTQDLLHDAAARLEHTQNTQNTAPSNTPPPPTNTTGGINKHSAGYGILKAIMKEVGVSGGTASTGTSPRMFRPLGGGSRGSRAGGAAQGKSGGAQGNGTVDTASTSRGGAAQHHTHAAAKGSVALPPTTSAVAATQRATAAPPSSSSTHQKVVVGQEVFSQKTVASDRRSGEMVRTGTISNPHEINHPHGINHPNGINHPHGIHQPQSLGAHDSNRNSDDTRVGFSLSSSSLEAPGTPNAEPAVQRGGE